MTTGAKIDPAAVEQVMTLGGQALLDRLVTIFKDVAASRMEAAHAALAAGDLTAIHRELHSIRSSAGNLGCTELCDSCLVIERAILDGHTVDFPALMADLDGTMARAQAALLKLTTPVD